MVAAIFRELGDSVQEALRALGRYALFAARVAGETPRSLLRFRLVVEQVYNAGALSLVIIMLSGLFVGMVLGLQGFDLLQRFGSEESLGTAAALGLLKELGPVITALLFAGRAISFFGTNVVPVARCSMNTAFQLSNRIPRTSPSSEK